MVWGHTWARKAGDVERWGCGLRGTMLGMFFEACRGVARWGVWIPERGMKPWSESDFPDFLERDARENLVSSRPPNPPENVFPSRSFNIEQPDILRLSWLATSGRWHLLDEALFPCRSGSRVNESVKDLLNQDKCFMAPFELPLQAIHCPCSYCQCVVSFSSHPCPSLHTRYLCPRCPREPFLGNLYGG